MGHKSLSYLSYVGITYSRFLQNKLILWLWKKLMCPRHQHLFDEVWSPDDWYLYCDACGLTIDIKSIHKQPC